MKKGPREAPFSCEQIADGVATRPEDCRHRVVGDGGVFGIRLGALAAAALGLLEPVAFAVHLKDVHVMSEPVEQRAGEPLGAEHAGPFLEWQVRRDMVEPFS